MTAQVLSTASLIAVNGYQVSSTGEESRLCPQGRHRRAQGGSGKTPGAHLDHDTITIQFN